VIGVACQAPCFAGVMTHPETVDSTKTPVLSITFFTYHRLQRCPSPAADAYFTGLMVTMQYPAPEKCSPDYAPSP
ncbi:hypothetical protein, partial [Halomonas urumqiensis]